MPSTTPYRFGDVVLVDYLFTSLNQTKRRPASVVSSDAYNRQSGDIVLMAVTSKVSQSIRFGSVKVVDWSASGLRAASVIKPVFFTFEKQHVKRRLGHLDSKTKADIKTTLVQVLG